MNDGQYDDWRVVYDFNTERHRIYAADGGLIAEVGNAEMGYDRQYAIARAMVAMAADIINMTNELAGD